MERSLSKPARMLNDDEEQRPLWPIADIFRFYHLTRARAFAR